MANLPHTAAWRHVDSREGFEVLFTRTLGGAYRLEGHSTAIEEGEAWSIRYTIDVGPDWATRAARIASSSVDGEREVRIEGDGSGGWTVDGAPAAHLTGCLDVDLEASACTNLLPVRRLALQVGERADAPAVYVGAPTLAVERLEQSYTRLDDSDVGRRYDYASPRFDFHAVLVFDRHGLVVDYPGIATRIA